MLKKREWGGVMLISFLVLLSCKYPERALPNEDVFANVDTLELVFSIGDELGDSTNMFWSIADAAIDDQGRILVLDDVDASVRVFDYTGEYIQNLTRSGSGPGELLLPVSMAIFPDGRIVISDQMKFGYIVFSKDFELVEEKLLWGDNTPYLFIPVSCTKLLVCRYSENPHTDVIRHTAEVYDLHENRLELTLFKDSLTVKDYEWDNNPSVPLLFASNHLQCSTDFAGNIYLSSRDTLQYQVLSWDSLGNQAFSIEMDLSPVEKEPEEINAEAIYLRICYQRRQGWPPWEPIPYGHRFMTEELGIGPDQNLWVRRGTRTDLFFDVFDLDGNLVRHVLYPLDSWSWKTVITPHGILAWELDPLDGYQKLHLFR